LPLAREAGPRRGDGGVEPRTVTTGYDTAQQELRVRVVRRCVIDAPRRRRPSRCRRQGKAGAVCLVPRLSRVALKPSGRGLHSSSYLLNVSAFGGMAGPLRGCLGAV